MADYTDGALQASIKALEQVVLPALDPADPLAGEQLRLVAGFLGFLRQRLGSWHARRAFELDHYLDLGRDAQADARLLSEDVAARLRSAIEHGERVRAQNLPAEGDQRAATAELAACISALVRLTAGADAALRARLQRKVMQGSRRWVEMQRAWFAPQGFEMRASELPPLDRILNANRLPT